MTTEGQPHRPEPKLMPAGQEWYCVRCNKTVHRHGGSWRHNPDRRPWSPIR